MNEPVPIKKEEYLITPVAPEEVASIWSQVKDLLEPAVIRSNGRWTMEHLLSVLVLGKQQLWVVHDNVDKVYAALTTQIVDYPNCSMIACQFLGGTDFELWNTELMDTIKEFAKQAKCAGLEIVGRAGFWPFFKGEGLERSYTVFEYMRTDE